MGPERMRCVLAPMIRIARSVLPIVLMLAAAPTTVSAQSLVCHQVRRGESATQVARRITGDSRNAYQTWFQIRNASSRFVPKSQYNGIRAGWHACVRKPIIQRASAKIADDALSAAVLVSDASVAAAGAEALPLPAAGVTPAALVTSGTTDDVSESPLSRAREIMRAIASAEFAMIWLGAAMIVPWFGWRILDGHLVRKKTKTIVMKHFATRFVHEFERPLRWSAAERPLRSRVRYSARRGRLDILLAPGKGRRYPNLLDHKNNTEYDIARVVSVLADPSFMNGPPYSQAGWVVVPFQFKTGTNQSGVTCISSF